MKHIIKILALILLLTLVSSTSISKIRDQFVKPAGKKNREGGCWTSLQALWGKVCAFTNSATDAAKNRKTYGDIRQAYLKQIATIDTKMAAITNSDPSLKLKEQATVAFNTRHNARLDTRRLMVENGLDASSLQNRDSDVYQKKFCLPESDKRPDGPEFEDFVNKGMKEAVATTAKPVSDCKNGEFLTGEWANLTDEQKKEKLKLIYEKIITTAKKDNWLVSFVAWFARNEEDPDKITLKPSSKSDDPQNADLNVPKCGN